jgi:hypothetical protein
MSSQEKNVVPPAVGSGFRIFIRSSYTARYNFAVANYNAVCKTPKALMRDAYVLLYRSVVAVVWIVSMAFALLGILSFIFFIGTLILSLLYIALSLYNAYVFLANRDLLNATRLLRAKVAGPNGLDCEWVAVPIDSRSANERLAAVEQSALDNVRKEFAGNPESEINCLVYTKRYADIYPAFPKELLIHLIGFVIALVLGIIIMTAI